MRSFVITLLPGLALWGLVLLHDSNASVFDKKTIWTFNEAVQIPGMVLDPGTYVMKRALPMTNPQVVRFLDASEKHVYATVFAIPVERQRPTSEPEITFAEARGGAPHALKRWFYPGELTGAEFVYPKESTVLAASVTEQPPITYRETYEAESETAQTSRPAEEPLPMAPEAATEAPRAQVEEPFPSGVKEEEQGLAPKPEPAMPQTASNIPLLLLLGGMAFAVGTAFKKAPWKQRS